MPKQCPDKDDIINFPKLLVVEGIEEVFFFEALKKHLRIQNLQIETANGKNQMVKYIRNLKTYTGFEGNVTSLGIIRDADENPEDAFDSVCNALKGAGLPTPQKPLVSVGDNPKVNVMIMPGNNEPGMLEDLCLKSVVNDPATECVDKYFDCLKRKCTLPEKDFSKAKVHVFLASRKEPDRRLGEAAVRGYWPFDNEVFNQVKQFLQEVAS